MSDGAVEIVLRKHRKGVYLCPVRSLQMLLDYTEDDLEETFCLNFTVRGISSESVHGGSSLKKYFDVCIYFL